MAEITHLSFSSINAYLLCGHAWRLHYIERIQTPTAPALVIGSAWHDAVEDHLRSGADLATRYREHLATRLGSEEVAWDNETPESLAAVGERMAAAKPIKDLLAGVRADFDPEHGALERRVELRVPGVPVPVIGYIDVITNDGVPGDFKTAARMWGDDKAASEMQPLVYLAALNQAGDDGHGWRFRHYVCTKATRPTARVFETQRSPGEVLTGLIPTIVQVWGGIQAGVFPQNTTTWKCSPRYCDYWDMCRGAV